MSDEIQIRKAGQSGRITLNRPEALNALTYDMCLKTEAALNDWAEDDDVRLVIIDAKGEKAFCAGGDIAEMYATAKAGNYGYGRKFWADEYRLNAAIFNYPKPYIAFMQGFTMGGGVGVSCLGSHRVVGASSRIAMPECSIGLIPDVGGSLLLSRAPGHLGEYLGTTGTRMGPGDAILAGFADHYIPEADWPELIRTLERTGDTATLEQAARTTPEASLEGSIDLIERHFAGGTAIDILTALRAAGSGFAQDAIDQLSRQSPLSVACAVEVIHRVRGASSIEPALAQEFRFVWRAAEHGDFIEGIRAAIIDKDRRPVWRHGGLGDVTDAEVETMLGPLGENELKL